MNQALQELFRRRRDGTPLLAGLLAACGGGGGGSDPSPLANVNAIFATVPPDLRIAENQSGAGGSGPIDVGSPVTASDADGDPVSYSLQGEVNGEVGGFAIDAGSGQIRYVGAGLDFESTPRVRLVVIATSTGANGRPTNVEQSVTIVVTDVDEATAHVAVFAPVPTDLRIAENQSGAGGTGPIDVGSPVTASDADGDPVTYSLQGEVNGEVGGFAIDAGSGQIRYVGPGLDFESTPRVRLVVIATSTGANGRSTDVEQPVTIMVTDVVDGVGGVRDFSNEATSVIVNLATTPPQFNGVPVPEWGYITDLVGSPFDDSLTGNIDHNRLRGGAGADVLDGGAGSDTADYAGSDAAVTVDLSSPGGDGYVTGSGGHAAGDKLKNIEWLDGSGHGDILTGATGRNGLRGRDGADTLIGGDGDDRLLGDDGADTLLGGDGNDRLYGDAGADVLDGGAGSDRVNYRGSDMAVIVDLSSRGGDGYGTGSGGHAAGDKLKGVEWLDGSDYDDVLTGDDNDNGLLGWLGADTLSGGKGRDSLYGYYGADVLRGGDDDDYLSGEQGVDTLMGGADNDELRGGAGADLLDGGAGGGDKASYSDSSAAVTIDLSSQSGGYSRGSGGHAAGDQLKNVEWIDGSGYDDTLTGDGGDNRFDGRAGADTLTGGGGSDTLVGGFGPDRLHGGAGFDAADYADSTGAVTIDLAAAGSTGYVTASGGYAAGDELREIEELRGSDNDDVLTGDDTANRLVGRAGADTLAGGGDADTLVGGDGADSLAGGGDADTLVGGDGADSLAGGSGTDTADYSGSRGAVTVNLLPSLGTDYGTGTGGDAEGDRLRGIENLVGSAYDDVLVGDGGVNTLDGGKGADAADYSASTLAIMITLRGADPATVTGGSLGEDRLLNIENLIGSAYADSLAGDAEDNVLEGGAGVDSLDGRAGSDTVDYSASTLAVTITLRGADQVTVMGGSLGEDRLRNIENLIGTSGDDSLTGDAQDNVLEGGVGADSLEGGSGSDTADYSASTAGVEIFLQEVDDNGIVTGTGGHAEGDRLKSIENVIGSAFNDVLRGDDKNNILIGGRGSDEFKRSGLGADTMDGGEGSDIVDYADSNAAVTIDFSSPGTDGYVTGKGGHAEGDKLKGIESFDGSSYGDIVTGDDNDNFLYGYKGENTLSGGNGDDVLYTGEGADTMDGGAGFDIASYSDSNTAVTVDLSSKSDGDYSTGSGGWAEGDRLKNIQELTGSRYDDRLTGNADQNHLYGGDGDDTLVGGKGEDDLYGDEGADILMGGDDRDVLYGGSDADTLMGGDDRDFLYGGSDADTLMGGKGEDYLYGDEGADILMGGDDRDVLYGGSDADTLMGGKGEDYLYGDEGADILMGGDDRDVLYGGSDADALMGGKGEDYLYGDEGADTLIPGNGSDSLWGGAGADFFRPGVYAEPHYQRRDTIWDFVLGEDKIDLRGITDWDTDTLGEQTNIKFIGTTAFQAPGEIRYEVVVGTGILLYVNLDSETTPELEISLVDLDSIAVSDFIAIAAIVDATA